MNMSLATGILTPPPPPDNSKTLRIILKRLLFIVMADLKDLLLKSKCQEVEAVSYIRITVYLLKGRLKTLQLDLSKFSKCTRAFKQI